ncbi:MAG: lipoprotein carrier protein LolA [Desulfobacterales bacterium]|nr:MAG: lipoprotein carrier protein LolA [Desulfobacterales bacterium]
MLRFNTFIVGLIFGLTTMLALPVMVYSEKAPPKESILTGLEQRYANKEFSAHFEQISKLTALDITETATGKAVFSHPGKMRWTYNTPDRHEIITNGKVLWIFRPDQHQVMTGDAQAFFKSGAGGAFLSDIKRIRKEFDITIEKTKKTFAVLRLIPKQQRPELSSVQLIVGLPDHNIQTVITQNPYGDTTQFVFTHIRFDAPNPETFEFIIPEDTEVIEIN